MSLLIVIVVILLILLGFVVYLLSRSLSVIRGYEDFFNLTIDDVDAIIETLEELMYRRQIISDDPDIRGLMKALNILREILSGYRNALNGKPRKDTNKSQ